MKSRKKGLITIVVIAAIILSLTVTFVNPFAKVRLKYDPYGEGISVMLTEEEAKAVKKILFLQFYDLPGGVPSCGYSGEVCLQVGLHKFAIARDMCPSIMDMANLRCLTLSRDEIDYIHALFEKYGGKFPNI